MLLEDLQVALKQAYANIQFKDTAPQGCERSRMRPTARRARTCRRVCDVRTQYLTGVPATRHA